MGCQTLLQSHIDLIIVFDGPLKYHNNQYLALDIGKIKCPTFSMTSSEIPWHSLTFPIPYLSMTFQLSSSVGSLWACEHMEWRHGRKGGRGSSASI